MWIVDLLLDKHRKPLTKFYIKLANPLTEILPYFYNINDARACIHDRFHPGTYFEIYNQAEALVDVGMLDINHNFLQKESLITGVDRSYIRSIYKIANLNSESASIELVSFNGYVPDRRNQQERNNNWTQIPLTLAQLAEFRLATDLEIEASLTRKK